jgi:hypothetical protein
MESGMNDATNDGPAAGEPEVLQIDHFEPHVGKIFHFKGTRYAFRLDHIVKSEHPVPSWMKRQPFILVFHGPKERDVMREGSYEAAVEAGPTFRLHVAPIMTPDPGRQDYQAVFN